MSEIILVPLLNVSYLTPTIELKYPLAISRLFMSFFTFHTAIFLSATESALMIVFLSSFVELKKMKIES
jgi:hypothetical protein